MCGEIAAQLTDLLFTFYLTYLYYFSSALASTVMASFFNRLSFNSVCMRYSFGTVLLLDMGVAGSVDTIADSFYIPPVSRAAVVINEVA